MMLSREASLAFLDEMEKISATRQVKEMRKLYEAGNFGGLKRLAGKLYGSGAQADSPGGIQVAKHLTSLGHGAEGAAVPVIGPHGQEVRKQFDPKGLWSRGLREDKAKLMRSAEALGDDHVAKIYGEHEHPDFAIHRMEHVPGQDVQTYKREQALLKGRRTPADRLKEESVDRQLDATPARLDAAAAHAGVTGHHDAVWRAPDGSIKRNPSNVFVQPDGHIKVIDVLPHPRPVGLHPEDITPGNVDTGPTLRGYFPHGIAPADKRGKTPLVDLTKKLGPSSRQAPKPVAWGARPTIQLPRSKEKTSGVLDWFRKKAPEIPEELQAARRRALLSPEQTQLLALKNKQMLKALQEPEKTAGKRTDEVLHALTVSLRKPVTEEHRQAWTRHSALNAGQALSQAKQAITGVAWDGSKAVRKEEAKDALQSLAFTLMPPNHHKPGDLAGMRSQGSVIDWLRGKEKRAAESDLTLYHASTRPDLKEIEPRLDPRTGEKAIFAKTYKEGTAPFALAGQSSYGNISHSTKAGKFTGGKAEVRKQLADEGWIYEIHVPSDKAEKHSENTYLLREKATPSAIHKITRQEAEAMGWKFEKKAEYAKGLPDKKKTSPVRLVEKPEHWRMVLQHHPAQRAGAHHDLRLNDPAPGGISHSWATKKDWPKPGERIRLFQQPDHKPSYSDFQGHLLSGYGKTKPGSKGVQKVMDERVEIKRTSDKLIRFDVFRKEGELPDRYVLVKAKHDGKGHPPWVLINHGKAKVDQVPVK